MPPQKKKIHVAEITPDTKLHIYSELNKINLAEKIIRRPYNISSNLVETHNTIFLEEAKKDKFYAPPPAAPRGPPKRGGDVDSDAAAIYTFYY